MQVVFLYNSGRVFRVPGLLGVYPNFDVSLWAFTFTKGWYYADIVPKVGDGRTTRVCFLDSHNEGTVIGKLPL